MFNGRHQQMLKAERKENKLTLPARLARRLNANFNQHILGSSLLPTVIGCYCQFILVFFTIA